MKEAVEEGHSILKFCVRLLCACLHIVSESEACVCLQQHSGFLMLFREMDPVRRCTGNRFNDICAMVFWIVQPNLGGCGIYFLNELLLEAES